MKQPTLEALRLASIRRHFPFLTPAEKLLFAPSPSELAIPAIALRMGVRLPVLGAAS